MADTAIFNVGGREYKVARTLLDTHPDSMLSRFASETWGGDDPEKELFIERDCDRFRLCLDYMRDGKVFLPMSVNKESLVADLEYYAVDVDKSCIHVENSDAIATLVLRKCQDILGHLVEQREKLIHERKEMLERIVKQKEEKEKEFLILEFLQHCYCYYLKALPRKKLTTKVKFEYNLDQGRYYDTITTQNMEPYKNDPALTKLFSSTGLIASNFKAEDVRSWSNTKFRNHFGERRENQSFVFSVDLESKDSVATTSISR